MREIRRVIVHHSASRWADAAEIDRWHRARGFDSIGYHRVILNGQRGYNGPYDRDADGLIETGRPLEIMGAHAGRVNANHDSIGVCLIGTDGVFTRWQFCSLLWLLTHLNERFAFGVEDVVGHKEIDPQKPECPSFNMELLRAALSVTTKGEA